MIGALLGLVATLLIGLGIWLWPRSSSQHQESSDVMERLTDLVARFRPNSYRRPHSIGNNDGRQTAERQARTLSELNGKVRSYDTRLKVQDDLLAELSAKLKGYEDQSKTLAALGAKLRSYEDQAAAQNRDVSELNGKIAVYDERLKAQDDVMAEQRRSLSDLQERVLTQEQRVNAQTKIIAAQTGKLAEIALRIAK